MKLSLLIALFTFTASAQARSLHPCTPTVRAADSRLFCSDKKASYSIRIHTLMSRPIPECQGEDYAEFHTATVTVTSKKTNKSKTYEIFDGFDFGLGLPGTDEGYFQSENPELDLSGCATPAHGGVSIGN